MYVLFWRPRNLLNDQSQKLEIGLSNGDRCLQEVVSYCEQSGNFFICTVRQAFPFVVINTGLYGSLI